MHTVPRSWLRPLGETGGNTALSTYRHHDLMNDEYVASCLICKPLQRPSLPAKIISHCVWLYFRFSLNFRDVEEMMAERGVVVSYESVRERCLKFGAAHAKRIRAHGPRPGDRWHLDEVFLRIRIRRLRAQPVDARRDPPNAREYGR